MYGNRTEKKNEQLTDREEKREYTLTVQYPKNLSRQAGEDILFSMIYDGNGMEVFLQGKKVNDYFYTGQEAVFSLGYFDFPEELLPAEL